MRASATPLSYGVDPYRQHANRSAPLLARLLNSGDILGTTWFRLRGLEGLSVGRFHGLDWLSDRPVRWFVGYLVGWLVV